MLVKYLWDGNNRIGCIVALSPENIGLSICNPKDQFCKRRAKQIAEGRAQLGCETVIPMRDVWAAKFPKKEGEYLDLNSLRTIPLAELVEREVKEMQERATKYFKVEDSEK